MADGRPQAPGALTARLALAAAAVAVAAAGLRATVPATSWDGGRWRQDGIALGLGLEAVFAVLLVAVEMRRRRDPDAGQPAAGLRAGLRAFLITALIALPVLVLADGVGHLPARKGRPQRPPTGRLRTPSPPPSAHATHGGGIDVTPALYGLLIAAVLLAAAITVVLIRRRAPAAAWAEIGELEDEEPAAALRRAVASGRAALADIDDARQAIIACYVAMEASLARAGTLRGAAETPDELLGRAARAGLAGGGAAATLTALFYEARFSTHPLPDGARDEARDALAELAAALADRAAREAAAAAAKPPATGPSGTGPSGTGASGTGASGTGASGTGPSGTGPPATGPPATGASGTGASRTGQGGASGAGTSGGRTP
jgi:hypothetical protein